MTDSVGDERKADALQRVLESPDLCRADLLKSLLTYLWRQEAQARAHEVTEYELALKVFGRPNTFSPDTDSTVRTRLMALRRKLEQYYAGEGRDAPLRIEIPRGTYALRFVESPPAAAVDTCVPSSEASTTDFERRPVPIRHFLIGAATALALAIAVFGLWHWLSSQHRSRSEANLRQAWGPILEPGATVTVVVGTPPSFFIRDLSGDRYQPIADTNYQIPVPRDAGFESWYAQVRGRSLGRNALLFSTIHSPLWGDAAAAAVLSGFFGAHGVSVEVAPALRVHPVALRESSSVIIGRPEYTDAASALVPDGALRIEYDPEKRRFGVHNVAPKPGEPQWWFRENKHSFGLVTVLGSAPPSKRRIVLFSGVDSDGSEAGARFLTAAKKLGELGQRFQAAAMRQWPARFQIVIRTDSMDTYCLDSHPEFLRILQ